MSKLNFRQTEILWAIVMAGSSSGAARLLNVSQPAVSKMLAQIEAQLGVLLFERVRGKLQPTQHVRMLFDEIERAQKVMRRVNDIADGLSNEGGGALSIASIPSLAYSLLPGAVERFHRDHRDVVVRIDTGPVPVMIDAVLQGEAELGLLVLLTDHPLLTIMPLQRGRMFAAIPRSNSLADSEVVSLADLSPYPHILVGSRMPFGMLTLTAFEQAGVPCRVCADVPNSQQACAMVNAGIGAALVDEFTATSNLHWPEVVIRPLRERIPLRMSIAHSQNRDLSPMARKFVQILRG